MKVETKGSDFSSSNINVSHDMTVNNDDALFASAGQIIAKLKSILTKLMSEMREAERERGLTLAVARFKQLIEVYNDKKSEADGRNDAAIWKAAFDCAGGVLQALGAFGAISQSTHLLGQLSNGANSALSGGGSIKSAEITLAAEKLKAGIDLLESQLQEITTMKNNSDETRQRLTLEMESMMKELLAAAKELQQALVK
ncbi:hypothetical protein [Aeromonas jandaei]|uniref:hypothetical protein n=1 Tax=Aeromonas jandaei TaxID=650 RepID=UPI001116F3A9|nr:hypothetical protein [Aeromonas jandaei]TNH94876.1 hypothetical protein CF104_20185 [Aeromonas jandaei]